MIIKSAYIKVEKKQVMGNEENIAITYEVKFDANEDVVKSTEAIISMARAIIDEEKEVTNVVTEEEVGVEVADNLVGDLFNDLKL